MVEKSIFDLKKFKIEKENGVANIKYEDEGVFMNNTSVPKTVQKEYEAYREEYLTAATEVAKDIAKKEMLSDKKLEKAVISFPYGTSTRSSANILVDREHTYPGTKFNDNKEITKSTIKVVVKDAKAKVSKSVIRGFEEELTKALLK